MAKPPVDYQTFCQDLLPSWNDDAPIAADDTVGSARDAARRALYRAATTAETGVILVIAPSAEQRVVTGFLDAMCKSQKMLAGVRGRVEVCTAERAPLVRDAVATIVLSDAPTAGRDMDASEATRRVAHILIAAMHGRYVDETLPIIAKLYPDEDPRGVLEFMIKDAEERSAARAAERKQEFRDAQANLSGNLPKEAFKETSVPIVPRMNRDDLLASPEFNAKLAADRGLSEMRGKQGRAVTSKNLGGL